MSAHVLLFPPYKGNKRTRPVLGSEMMEFADANEFGLEMIHGQFIPSVVLTDHLRRVDVINMVTVTTETRFDRLD